VETFEPTPVGPQTPFPNGAIPERVHLRGWALASVLIGLMLTLFLSALDQTIVATALPKILTDLNGDQLYIWPATAYLLTSTLMIPIVGKLSDLFGRKWFLIFGVIVFLAGSALSGASQTIYQLIYFRGFQGIGGGVLLALVFTLVGDIFTPAERARWQGLFTSVFALASVVGPFVGGVITDNFTWRWIFYVNLPVGVVALAALLFWLPANISVRTATERGWAAIRRIDFLGSLTASGATVCLLLGLTWGGYQLYDWSSPQVIGTLAGAVALYIAFILIEIFVANEPILPLDLFRNRVFTVGASLSFLTGAALFSVALFLPLFIQGVLGDTATNSGAAITPLTLSMAPVAALMGFLIGRVGRYQFAAIIGTLVLVGGTYLLTTLTASTTLLTVTLFMIVVGIGLGMVQPVLTLSVQNAIPRARLGVGTGAVTYMRSTGSTVGLGVLGAVEFSTYSTELAKRLPAAAQNLPAAALKPATVQQLLTSSQAIKQTVLNNAIHAAVAQAVPAAVAQATASVPAGPQHDAIVAQITQQITAQVTAAVTQQVTILFSQVLEAARQATALGIHNAFIVGVIVTVLMVGLSLFLRDVPLQRREPAPPQPVAPGATPSPFGPQDVLEQIDEQSKLRNL
jgi:EmrB/QacA subfamily drug resistance transporter